MIYFCDIFFGGAPVQSKRRWMRYAAGLLRKWMSVRCWDWVRWPRRTWSRGRSTPECRL